MINIANIQYRVVGIMPDGTKLDLTTVCTDVGWEEGARELSARISMKVYNGFYMGKQLSEIVQPNMPVYIYAIMDGVQVKVCTGTIARWKLTFTNGQTAMDITAYDEMIALRRNQDSLYFSDGTGTKAIITQILDKWGVPYDYKGPDVQHAKTVFKKKYLSDMVLKILDDAKMKGAGVYFMRANNGKVEIIPRGTNTTTYHLDAMNNTVSGSDDYDASAIVTRVTIVAKSDKEGHQAVLSTIDGDTKFGIRQVIYERPQDKTLEDATTAAKQILKEKGALKRKTTLTGPDIPTLRKGDRVRVRVGTIYGYFFVKSIRHNADDGKMSLEITEDKEKNKEEANKQSQQGTTSSVSTTDIDTDTGDETTGDDVQ